MPRHRELQRGSLPDELAATVARHLKLLSWEGHDDQQWDPEKVPAGVTIGPSSSFKQEVTRALMRAVANSSSKYAFSCIPDGDTAYDITMR